MKAIVAERPGELRVAADVPMPVLAPYESLVRVLACGFCNGTDAKIAHGNLANMTTKFPVILGHEGVGEVIETGAKVRNWRVGDRVTNPSYRLEPGTSYTPMWGEMSQYGFIADEEVMLEMGMQFRPRIGLKRIPADIPAEDGPILLSLKEALSAVRNFGFSRGMDALVYGDGPMGLALVQFLRMSGAGWIGCVGHWDARLEKIARIGKADATINTRSAGVPDFMKDRKVDLVIDAVGSSAIIAEGARLLKPGGTLGVTGVIKAGKGGLDLLGLPNHVRIHMLTFPRGEHDLHDEVLRMVQDCRVNLKDYYSHVLPVDQGDRALKLIESREAYKVIIKMH
jgi:threonine dehydrogenase-like Zn-dependent dehydrogenase